MEHGGYRMDKEVIVSCALVNLSKGSARAYGIMMHSKLLNALYNE